MKNGFIMLYVFMCRGITMQKVKVMVSSQHKVVRNGIAAIIDSSQNLEVVGQEGLDVLAAAINEQPDLLVYELVAVDNNEFELITKIKSFCNWTKIIVFTADSLHEQKLVSLLNICDGYLQGPVLPGFFIKAIELACYSGYYFYLGSSRVLIKA
jgi:DNA-binding NarL/FixJ family response regulator